MYADDNVPLVKLIAAGEYVLPEPTGKTNDAGTDDIVFRTSPVPDASIILDEEVVPLVLPFNTKLCEPSVSTPPENVRVPLTVNEFVNVTPAVLLMVRPLIVAGKSDPVTCALDPPKL